MDDDVREALARLIDPDQWHETHPVVVYPKDPAQQAVYERFFWEGVANRRAPSLAAADRIIAAGVRPRGTVTPPGLLCPACGWSTWNREVEQHVCPGPSYAAALRAIADGDGPEFVREFARDALKAEPEAE